MINNSKKRSFIVTMITFILMISMTALRPVHADDDDDPEYTISKLNINCQIEKNGAVRLTRTVTYNFDDDADDIYKS